MRLVMLLVIGIVIGGIATHMIDHAIDLRHAYPRGVMTVMQHHAASMRQSVRSGQCPVQATTDHLQAMHNVSQEIGPAFGTADPHFNDYAQRLRDSLAQAATHPPADCKALAGTLKEIGGHCSDCHREYR